MRRLWKYSILCSVVLLSLLLNFSIVKNSNAAVVDLSGFDLQWAGYLQWKQCQTVNCGTEGNPAWSFNITPNSDGTAKLFYGFKSTATREFKKGDIIEFSAVIKTVQEYDAKGPEWRIALVPGSNDDWTILGLEEVYDSSYENQSGFYGNGSNLSNSNSVEFSEINAFYKHIRFTMIARHDGTFPVYWGINDGAIMTVFAYPTPSSNNPLNIRTYVISHYRKNTATEEMNEKDNEDRNNIESQSSQTESDADQSKEDVEQGTSSLISTISSFSTMLAGIHTTNCRLPEISAYGFNLGRIDICTFSPPSWVSVVGNVIVSLIAVRLAIAIFRRIMGIIKGVGE